MQTVILKEHPKGEREYKTALHPFLRFRKEPRFPGFLDLHRLHINVDLAVLEERQHLGSLALLKIIQV